jgi:ribosomal protein S18 acetylase RimI-like enzyme
MDAPAIRPATPEDHDAVVTCVHAAFVKWVPIIGMKPLAVLADYAAFIQRQVVYVLEGTDELAGVLILWPVEDALYVDTVAVHPLYQKTGLGRRLMKFAEQQAREAGLQKMTLVTNEKMVENQHYYKRLGYVETRREELTPGRRAVWMYKLLLAE